MPLHLPAVASGCCPVLAHKLASCRQFRTDARSCAQPVRCAASVIACYALLVLVADFHTSASALPSSPRPATSAVLDPVRGCNSGLPVRAIPSVRRRCDTPYRLPPLPLPVHSLRAPRSGPLPTSAE